MSGFGALVPWFAGRLTVCGSPRAEWTIEGMPETASVGHDMIEEIRHVEGVVAVRDRLSYPDERPVPGPGPLF